MLTVAGPSAAHGRALRVAALKTPDKSAVMADAAQPSALSLSVSAFKLEGSATLSKRPSSRSLKVPEPDDGREYISHFDAEDRQARPAKPVRAIPCKPNTTLATPAAAAAARLAAGDAPASTLDGRFAAATEQREGDGVYGLVSAPAAPGSSARARAPAPSSRPDASELRLDELPDAPSHDAYDDTPVDGFGEAMLRGMGMTEETTTGTVAFVPRPARMGLGAKPTDVSASPASRTNSTSAADHLSGTRDRKRPGPHAACLAAQHACCWGVSMCQITRPSRAGALRP